MDTNIDNYSIKDILLILNLDKNNLNVNDINHASSKIINKMNREQKYDLAEFFEKARTKLINGIRQSNEYKNNEDENNEYKNNEDENNEDENNEEEDDYDRTYNTYTIPPLFPPSSDQNEQNKYTDRNNQVKVENSEGTHLVMQKNRLGVIESHNVPIIQDTLNPNLTNTIKRIVSIDSQFRQNILPYSDGNPNKSSYNTDYTFDLTDSLSKVISLTLNSIQIPTTWYTFDNNIGNTCFKCNTTIITIPSGNYKATDLETTLNTNAILVGLHVSFNYNSITGKMDIINGNNLPITITFYQNGGLLCSSNGCGSGQKINQHLGWNLGFRIDLDANGDVKLVIPGNGGKATSNVPVDVYGPKYFLLAIDDFNNNHINQGLVNISDTVSKLDMTSYFNSSMKNQPSVTEACIPVPVNLNNGETVTIPMIQKAFPRTLTQAQLYSTNEINANRKTTLNNRTKGTTSSDILSLLPLSGITNLRPDPYIVFGTNLSDSKRIYFGPVNIDRLRVRLFDDKGNLVNLNDNDWSFSLIAEQLYQY